jgi:hypothetical protein
MISEVRMRELHACAREAGDKNPDIKLKALKQFGRESLKDLIETEAIQLISTYRLAIDNRPRPVMPPMISRLPPLKVRRPPPETTPGERAAANVPAWPPQPPWMKRPKSLQGWQDGRNAVLDGVEVQWMQPPDAVIDAWMATKSYPYAIAEMRQFRLPLPPTCRRT